GALGTHEERTNEVMLSGLRLGASHIQLGIMSAACTTIIDMIKHLNAIEAIYMPSMNLICLCFLYIFSFGGAVICAWIFSYRWTESHAAFRITYFSRKKSSEELLPGLVKLLIHWTLAGAIQNSRLTNILLYGNNYTIIADVHVTTHISTILKSP
ncbi:hypothetical protein ACJX0J_005938, partial [Zea mays]